MAATTTQMNIRIDPALKAAGDAALAEIGFSPTEAVRALWTCVARRGKDAARVKAFLEDAAADASRPDDSPEISDAERFGWNIVPDGMAKLGITLRPHGDDWPSDEELLVRALEERMAERGCL